MLAMAGVGGTIVGENSDCNGRSGGSGGNSGSNGGTRASNDSGGGMSRIQSDVSADRRGAGKRGGGNIACLTNSDQLCKAW